VGSLTYQWYASTTSGGVYSAISGATAAAYNDSTTAPPATLTAGSTTASQGGSNPYVTISLSGDSIASGATEYYECYENATGASQQITSYTSGNILGGAITIQGQMSAADSDGSYSDISGATTSPYNDTVAPQGGVKRYYTYRVDAVGASEVVAAAYEGWTNYFVLNPPTNLTVTPSGNNTLIFNWTPDPKATATILVVGNGGYPTSMTDGTQIYNGSDSTYSYVGGSSEVNTDYISAWSYDANVSEYSLNSASITAGGGVMFLLVIAFLALGVLIAGFVFKKSYLLWLAIPFWWLLAYYLSYVQSTNLPVAAQHSLLLIGLGATIILAFAAIRMQSKPVSEHPADNTLDDLDGSPDVVAYRRDRIKYKRKVN
jgi:hypothetical protein